MDFATTARLLMNLQAEHPNLRYDFENGQVVIRMVVQQDVPGMFGQASQMFEPI